MYPKGVLKVTNAGSSLAGGPLPELLVIWGKAGSISECPTPHPDPIPETDREYQDDTHSPRDFYGDLWKGCNWHYPL